MILFAKTIRITCMCMTFSRYGAGNLAMGWAGVHSTASPNSPAKGGRLPHKGKRGGVWIKCLLLVLFYEGGGAGLLGAEADSSKSCSKGGGPVY